MKIYVGFESLEGAISLLIIRTPCRPQLWLQPQLVGQEVDSLVWGCCALVVPTRLSFSGCCPPEAFAPDNDDDDDDVDDDDNNRQTSPRLHVCRRLLTPNAKFLRNQHRSPLGKYLATTCMIPLLRVPYGPHLASSNPAAG